MHLSKLLGKTLRQPPSEAHLASHQLLARAGYVRGSEAGLFAYLPLGHLTVQRLKGLARREVSALGSQEIDAPAPADADPEAELIRLLRREIDSYRQLPLFLVQMGRQTVSQPGTRAGLFGATNRPAIQLSAFGPADLADVRPLATGAMERILSACGLEPVWADAGDAGRRAYFVHAAGDEEMARCPNCDYAAERSWATLTWPDPPDEPEQPIEEIETPGCNTIAALAEFLDIPASRTLKMVFYSVEGRVTCVVIRGDRSVDEAKLARLLGTDWYYASLEHELEEIGAVGGYASPIPRCAPAGTWSVGPTGLTITSRT
jgi:prolyl-tRNA synthetase